MTSKYWCFTENHNAEKYYDDLESLYVDQPAITYICGQLEEASTGQVHFQGYVQLDRSRRLSFLKNWVSETAHFEKQRGSNKQAREYCRKEESQMREFIEYGVFAPGRGGRGSRNDIHLLRDAIMEGKSQKELVLDDDICPIFSRNLRFHDRVRLLFKPKREDMENFKVILHYGQPGQNKTRMVYEKYPDVYESPVMNGTLWLDGYDNHKVVLLDDFAGALSHVELTSTLRMLDRYVVKMPVKGAYVWWMPDIIYITSNIHPRKWYDFEEKYDRYSWRALKRRFNQIFVFENDEVIEVDKEDFLEDRDYWPEERPNITQVMCH